MFFAIVTGVIGSLATLWIGNWIFNIGALDLLRSVLASNCAAFIALFFCQNSQLVLMIRKRFIRTGALTWVLFFSLYVLCTVLFSPILRDLNVFTALLFPLLVSTGFAMIPYGPVQDWMLQRRKRDER